MELKQRRIRYPLNQSYIKIKWIFNKQNIKKKAKHRYKIEAKNKELKNAHAYDRAFFYGINNMQMQGAMAIFTVKLKNTQVNVENNSYM